MKKLFKTSLKKLLQALVFCFRLLIVIVSLPFYCLFSAEGLLALLCFCLAGMGIAAIGGFLYIAAMGLFHWLSVTDVFRTHPFISFFVLWGVMMGFTGAVILKLQEVDWEKFKRKKKEPERKSRLPG